MSIIDFLIWVFFFSVLTIFVILFCVSRKGVIRWYLKLRIPTEAQTDKILNTISNEKTFNGLIKKWTDYNNARVFLLLQMAFLVGGFSTAAIYKIGQWQATLDLNYLVLLFILSLILITLVITWLSNILSNIFKFDIRIFDSKEKKGFLRVLLSVIIPIFFINIPMIMLLGYFALYNVVPDFKNGLSLYLVLTIGMYQSTKSILSFFLPVSANGLYSIEELIQEMIREK
jgi:hypothetical protein